MKNYWKQFAGWVIDSRHNIFQRARLKLTGLYIGIIAVILIVFSLTLYYSLAKNIQDNFEGNFSDEQAQELIIVKTTDQLQTTIVFTDFVILLIASGLSYFFAGKTLNPIQRAMEKQKQFTADASHELRTPLAVMRTNLEVALREREWNNEKGRALIVGAIDEVKLMAKLTEDLLTLSKLEGKGKPYSFTNIDLKELVGRVVKKMQNIATGRTIELFVDHADAAYIEGEAGALERLMMNIISNAIHFTSAGGYIRITIEKRGDKAMIRVQDTGIGISKKDLSHVFERFYRADKAREHDGGAGLGLTIAKEITRQHRGDISIESERGKGTLVIITFPVAY